MLNNGNPDRHRANEFELAKAERSALPSATDWCEYRKRVGVEPVRSPAPRHERPEPSQAASKAIASDVIPYAPEPPLKPKDPSFAREMFNLQPGTAAQILPELCKKYGGTEHEPALREAILKHRIYPWLKKKLGTKKWTQPVVDLLERGKRAEN